jgi:hypothetical protein
MTCSGSVHNFQTISTGASMMRLITRSCVGESGVDEFGVGEFGVGELADSMCTYFLGGFDEEPVRVPR